MIYIVEDNEELFIEKDLKPISEIYKVTHQYLEDKIKKGKQIDKLRKRGVYVYDFKHFAHKMGYYNEVEIDEIIDNIFARVSHLIDDEARIYIKNCKVAKVLKVR